MRTTRTHAFLASSPSGPPPSARVPLWPAATAAGQPPMGTTGSATALPPWSSIGHALLALLHWVRFCLGWHRVTPRLQPPTCTPRRMLLLLAGHKPRSSCSCSQGAWAHCQLPGCSSTHCRRGGKGGRSEGPVCNVPMRAATKGAQVHVRPGQTTAGEDEGCKMGNGLSGNTGALRYEVCAQ